MNIFPRRLASASAINSNHLANLKQSSSSKRGPKFRTPSKMKDSFPTAFAKDEIFDDDRGLDWNIWAYATADEYQMDLLSQRLKTANEYEVKLVAKDLPDVFRIIPKSRIDHKRDRREIFVFR